jgi:octaprenyl-diphosphate synthase
VLNSDPFLKIVDLISLDLKQVNQIIIQSSVGKAGLINEVTNYLITSGGKRVRPILTILASKICGYNNGSRHCNLAAAVELIHTATLLHDDVVDGSDLRRGKKTANAIWNNKTSILVGDYLFSVAFQLMVRDGSLEVLDILSMASGIMADGEVMQLMNSNDIDISQEKYLEIIACKTAILFSASTQVGAIITNSGSIKQRALADFGKNLGVAFQIMDDLLDYNSIIDQFGKKNGNDFFEGKITLPIILAYQEANKLDRSRIKEIFANNLINNQNDPKLFLEIIAIINKYKAIENSIIIATNYQNYAKNNLEIFAESPEKSMLLDISQYAISRQK